MNHLPSGNHNKSTAQRIQLLLWKLSEELLQITTRHTENDVLWPKLPSDLIFGTAKTIWFHCSTCATLEFLHEFIVFLIWHQRSPRFIVSLLSLTRTHSLSWGSFNLTEYPCLSLTNVLKFHRSCEAYMKWDWHSKVGRDCVNILWL